MSYFSKQNFDDFSNNVCQDVIIQFIWLMVKNWAFTVPFRNCCILKCQISDRLSFHIWFLSTCTNLFYLFIYLFIHLFICFFIYLFEFIYLFIYLFISLFIYLFIYYLFRYVFSYLNPICQLIFIYLFIYSFIYLFIYLLINLFLLIHVHNILGVKKN